MHSSFSPLALCPYPLAHHDGECPVATSPKPFFQLRKIATAPHIGSLGGMGPKEEAPSNRACCNDPKAPLQHWQATGAQESSPCRIWLTVLPSARWAIWGLRAAMSLPISFLEEIPVDAMVSRAKASISSWESGVGR